MIHFIFIVLSLVILAWGLFQGIRDLMGKDPIFRRRDDRYLNDPEYRAMWQKKDGIRKIIFCVFFALYIIFYDARFNGIFLILAAVVNVIYYVAYESWEHSND